MDRSQGSNIDVLCSAGKLEERCVLGLGVLHTRQSFRRGYRCFVPRRGAVFDSVHSAMLFCWHSPSWPRRRVFVVTMQTHTRTPGSRFPCQPCCAEKWRPRCDTAMAREQGSDRDGASVPDGQNITHLGKQAVLLVCSELRAAVVLVPRCVLPRLGGAAHGVHLPLHDGQRH